ncbi:penicillin-binding protein 2 [Sandaracinobacteroides saxicola]|uniref:Penicillin-binding protein 2 n=2 Tax=Sandaracinobacteroides saxicola TaxID=2759707 RepID=A0A7G5IMU8_9SPHN|nr:penicillin-binding protein 2 [Sandaracinobacteroides saxicola]
MALAVARQRMVIGLLIVFGLIAILILRLLELGLLYDGPDRRNAIASTVPARADITDRHGTPLARNFQAFAIAARPYDIVSDKRVLASRIAALLPSRSEAQIFAALTHPGKFKYIARRVLPADAEKIRRLGDPGITLEREGERLYPNLTMAAQVLGVMSEDGKGAGIERAFNARLSDPKLLGTPLALALDARVQQSLESELAFAMAKHSAEGAAGVVMDVHTGEVLAMASLPSWNPNAPGGAMGMPAYMNRATLAVFELGSTFKGFTIAMGLDVGTIPSLAKTYDARAPLHTGRFVIKDDHPQNRIMSVPDVFVYSSNIGTAKMALEYGEPVQREYLRRMGFLDKVSGELLEKGRTLYPPVSNWGQSAVMTVGFGHGIAVTPLHLAVAYSTLVNGGIYRPATFLKVDPARANPGRRVFKQSTSDTMRILLRAAVTEGTGGQADAPGYRVGGKTGTAEMPRPRELGGGYYHDKNITTFAGAFPMDAPRYAVIVSLMDGKGTKDTYGFRTAGWLAAPIFKRTVLRIAPVLGVAPDAAREVDMSSVKSLIVPKHKG